MTLQRIEVGLVSADETLVEFLATVFELKQLPTIESSAGLVYCLQAPGVVIKVMVPVQTPAPAEPAELFFARTGLRYFTMYVDDLDVIIERVTARGGRVQHDPMTIGSSMRVAVILDPDGNAIELVDGAQ